MFNNNQGRHLPPHQMYPPPPNRENSFKTSGSIGSGPQFYSKPPTNLPSNQTIEFDDGPKITVFIGNISDKVPDAMIRKIIAACGPVANWKRVSTFGFCEYDGPKSGARAVRLLHGYEVDGKKLVAKVDAKNQKLLDAAKSEDNRKSDVNNTRNSDAANEKKNDELTLERLTSILDEFKDELKAANSGENQQGSGHRQSKQTVPSIEIEEGKRDLINKEIGRFRKNAEEEEAKKEKDKKKRENIEKERSTINSGDKSRHTPSPERKSSSSSRRRSRSRDRERERERERREMDRRQREREVELREKEMRDRERFREQEPKVMKNPKEIQREKEMAEEEYERKRAQKRAREKHEDYLARLETWEDRERKKAKEYAKQREKELKREEKREREAKIMKEFLEDYDDERDDPKYYKGKAYKTRMADRLTEADDDLKDRDEERDELEKLKIEIFSGKYDNPTQEFERQKQEMEDRYKPKILIDINIDDSLQREQEILHEKDRIRVREKRAAHKSVAIDVEPIDSDSSGGNRFSPHNNNRGRSSVESREDIDDDDLSRNSLLSNTPTTPNSPGEKNAGGQGSGASGIGMGFSLSLNKKRKIDPKSAFSMDDEGEEVNGPAKKKLVPLDYTDENSATAASTQNVSKKSKHDAHQQQQLKQQKTEADIARSQEEKRKMHKQIIDKIPIDKADLFNHPLNRSEIDGTIRKKVQSWINKKIIEYIGEPEPTLVDFISSKLLAGSKPQSILDDVKMILDEEADIFVVKMWRLIIFEVEAKKLGIK